jgi:phosphoribosylformylglycinamidine synthase
MTLNFKTAGDNIIMLGSAQNDISSSEYLTKIIGEEYSPCPHFVVEEELALQKILLQLIADKKINSAHDISEGGLMITLLESSFFSNKGFVVTKNESVRKDAYWFGEAQSRVVISIDANNVDAVTTALNAASQPFSILGTVTDESITVDGENFGLVADWKQKYEAAIENIIAGGK